MNSLKKSGIYSVFLIFLFLVTNLLAGETITENKGNSSTKVVTNILLSGQQLNLGQYIESSNLKYRFYLQGDGNLVFRNMQTNVSIWSSATNGKNGTRLAMQGDGNLVLYTARNIAVWSSGTVASSITPKLIINDNGTLQLYHNSTVKWQKGTAVIPPTYALTITSGNGSGSYVAGASVSISANSAPTGKTFDKWVINSGNPVIGNINLTSTSLTMPANAASVTATYKNQPVVVSKNIGSITGFAYYARKKVASPHAGQTIYNLPMFQPESDNDFWDNLVEEFAYSGLDYMAPVHRGYLPNQNRDVGDPRKLVDLLAAMERRGLSDAFKIAIFDDNPASWKKAMNLDQGNDNKFDCSNVSNYKYIWDYNIKKSYEVVPDNKRFKIDSRPVIIFWHAGDTWFTNQGNGHLKNIMMYVRNQCKLTFGFNPYIIVAQSFVDKDPQINDPAVIDGVHGWFSMNNSYTVRTFNGTKIGALSPGFSKFENNTDMFIDPRHGQTLTEGLNATVNSGCKTTFIEGFTDFAENTALHRSEGGYAATYYDYPNQRLNIVRKFSGKDFVRDLKLEAEACDFYSDKTNGNSGNLYRKGNLDIVKTNDMNSGWHVTNTQAGEYLEWREIPLSKITNFSIRYKSTAEAKIRFSVNSTSLGDKVLPSTNGNWVTINNITACALDANGYHTLKVSIISGSPEINYFTLNYSSSRESDIINEATPKQSELFQNYPNPFNPVTTISFALSERGSVKLAVMNAKGETVKVLAIGNYQAGNHSLSFDGSGLNSGVYFYQLVTPERTITKKMLLVK